MRWCQRCPNLVSVPVRKYTTIAASQTIETSTMHTEFEDELLVTPRRKVDLDNADFTHVKLSQCTQSSKEKKLVTPCQKVDQNSA